MEKNITKSKQMQKYEHGCTVAAKNYYCAYKCPAGHQLRIHEEGHRMAIENGEPIGTKSRRFEYPMEIYKQIVGEIPTARKPLAEIQPNQVNVPKLLKLKIEPVLPEYVKSDEITFPKEMATVNDVHADSEESEVDDFELDLIPKSAQDESKIVVLDKQQELATEAVSVDAEKIDGKEQNSSDLISEQKHDDSNGSQVHTYETATKPNKVHDSTKLIPLSLKSPRSMGLSRNSQTAQSQQQQQQHDRQPERHTHDENAEPSTSTGAQTPIKRALRFGLRNTKKTKNDEKKNEE